MDPDEARSAFNEKRTPNFTGGLRKRGEAFPETTPEQTERLEGLRRATSG